MKRKLCFYLACFCATSRTASTPILSNSTSISSLEKFLSWKDNEYSNAEKRVIYFCIPPLYLCGAREEKAKYAAYYAAYFAVSYYFAKWPEPNTSKQRGAGIRKRSRRKKLDMRSCVQLPSTENLILHFASSTPDRSARSSAWSKTLHLALENSVEENSI